MPKEWLETLRASRQSTCVCHFGVHVSSSGRDLRLEIYFGNSDCGIVIQPSLLTHRKSPMRRAGMSTAQCYPASWTPSKSPAHSRSSNVSSLQQAQSSTVYISATQNSPWKNRTVGSKAMPFYAVHFQSKLCLGPETCVSSEQKGSDCWLDLSQNLRFLPQHHAKFDICR